MASKKFFGGSAPRPPTPSCQMHPFTKFLDPPLYVVAGCKSHLEKGIYTWRHNSVLLFLSKVFAKAKDIQLFADLDDFDSPCIITGHCLRQDMFIIFSHTLYIIELTVRFQSNVNANTFQQKPKYLELVDTFSQRYDAVKFVNVSMGTLGMFGTSCDTFVTMLNEVGTTQNQKDYLLKSMTNITIRCTYYIFCMWDKPWNDPAHFKL